MHILNTQAARFEGRYQFNLPNDKKSLFTQDSVENNGNTVVYHLENENIYSDSNNDQLILLTGNDAQDYNAANRIATLLNTGKFGLLQIKKNFAKESLDICSPR